MGIAGGAAIQQEKKLMWLSKAKCKVLHLSCQSQAYVRLGEEWIESISEEKDLGLLVNERMDMSWQCALAVQKANCGLGCIQSRLASRVRERIVPYYSTLVTPHPECCIQHWCLQHRKNRDLLEPVQEDHRNDQMDGTPLL